MELLNTYDDKETAEIFFEKIDGEKRLASERDATETVYNLYGQPTWKNFYLLDMFNLKELQGIIECRKNGQPFDQERHREIIKMLEYAAKSFDLIIPAHWR